jgi:hypothetical protein
MQVWVPSSVHGFGLLSRVEEHVWRGSVQPSMPNKKRGWVRPEPRWQVPRFRWSLICPIWGQEEHTPGDVLSARLSCSLGRGKKQTGVLGQVLRRLISHEGTWGSREEEAPGRGGGNGKKEGTRTASSVPCWKDGEKRNGALQQSPDSRTDGPSL